MGGKEKLSPLGAESRGASTGVQSPPPSSARPKDPHAAGAKPARLHWDAAAATAAGAMPLSRQPRREGAGQGGTGIRRTGGPGCGKGKAKGKGRRRPAWR
jgi:hypothetical protein